MRAVKEGVCSVSHRPECKNLEAELFSIIFGQAGNELFYLLRFTFLLYIA